MEYQLNSSVNFGKYNGKNIKYILDNDFGYLCWCVKEIEDFTICDEVAFLMLENAKNLSKSSRINLKLLFENKDEESEVLNIIMTNYIKSQMINYKSVRKNRKSW
ncbi:MULTISPECIES: hypothetical protein [unclassified Empedobacter]|uniref:exodeoxyribonuclease X C-terminal domain-containing protein n=1 Tax=unclassified Empedobacter TaxID=2643773 RepID=UPI00244ABCC0|nr:MULTISPECIES: hypothetical protein [unclassified Empedobacter]MDH1602840.1 hypothetical protein [Empedobacter sp. GD03739]